MKTIVLKNSQLEVTVMPELGGKISSFLLIPEHFELAAQSTHGEYRYASDKAKFSDYDLSGMDDAFPNIEKETIVYDGRQLNYPDHGEIWSKRLEVRDSTENSTGLGYDSEEFLYHYEKKLELIGNTLHMRYHIKNTGCKSLPCIWTMHALMQLVPGLCIRYPKGIKHIKNVLENNILGEDGKIYPYPSNDHDFAKFPDESKPYMMKYYGVERTSDGICEIEYPQQGVKCTISYDHNVFPWFGVWVTAGAFMGDYNFALEMTNGYYDSVSRAIQNNKICILKAGQELDFEISILLKRNSDIVGAK